MCTSRMIEFKDIPDYIKKEYESELLAEKQMIKTDCTEDNGKKLTVLVEEYEKNLIRASLDSTATLSEAAKKLGISKQALNYKIDKYGFRQK